MIGEGPRAWAGRFERIAAMSAGIGEISGVARVTSIATTRINSDTGVLPPLLGGETVSAAQAANRLDAALATPLILGRLLAVDGSAAVVVVQIDRSSKRAEQLAAIVSRVDDVAALGRTQGDRVSLGGLPFIRLKVIDAMNRDQLRLLPLGFAIRLVVLLDSFRWWPALVLAIAAVGFAALVCVGLMAWVGATLDVITNIVPLLIVIIGVSA